MSDNTTPRRSGKFLDTEMWDALEAVSFTDDELHDDQLGGLFVVCP